MKKFCFSFASMLLALSLLAGCGNGDNDVPPTDQPDVDQDGGMDGMDDNNLDTNDPNDADEGGDMGTGDGADTGDDADTGADQDTDENGIGEDDNTQDEQS